MKGLVLVGHGGVPKDYPKDRLSKLKALEGRRMATGGPMSAEEAALDREIRTWPRTPETEPYKFGLEALAKETAAAAPELRVVTCYNEFCGPTMEEAIEGLLGAGVDDVVVVTPMLTPGGYHSEIEIPEIVAALQRKHPGVKLRYAWPFDLSGVAGLLLKHAARF